MCQALSILKVEKKLKNKWKNESFNSNFILSLPQSSHFSPSQFFLSLSHSLCFRLLTSFSLFLILFASAFLTSFSLFLCLCCSVFIMVSLPFLASSLTSSSVHLLLLIELFLNRKKPTMEMLYIFFSELSSVHLLLFIMFFLFTGFN